MGRGAFRIPVLVNKKGISDTKVPEMPFLTVRAPAPRISTRSHRSAANAALRQTGDAADTGGAAVDDLTGFVHGFPAFLMI